MSIWASPRAAVLNDVAALLQKAADCHLPLSVRYAAAETALVAVEAWSEVLLSSIHVDGTQDGAS